MFNSLLSTSRPSSADRMLHGDGHLILTSSLQDQRYTTSTVGNRSFECAAPDLWNVLPPEIQHADSLVVLKHF